MSQNTELLLTILRKLNAHGDTLEYICKELNKVSGTNANIDAAVAALQAQVAQQTTVEGSAVTLLTSLSSQLTAALAEDEINPADAPNITAAIAALQNSATSLGQAITANTPAANPAPAAPAASASATGASTASNPGTVTLGDTGLATTANPSTTTSAPVVANSPTLAMPDTSVPVPGMPIGNAASPVVPGVPATATATPGAAAPATSATAPAPAASPSAGS